MSPTTTESEAILERELKTILHAWPQLGDEMECELELWVERCQAEGHSAENMTAALEIFLQSMPAWQPEGDDLRKVLRGLLKRGAPQNELEQQVRRLIEALLRAQNHERAEIYRQLAKLGQVYRASLPDFRRRLMRAGMSAPRASEITSLLRHDTVARKFIAGRYSVRQALRLARLPKQKPSPTSNAITRANRAGTDPATIAAARDTRQWTAIQRAVAKLQRLHEQADKTVGWRPNNHPDYGIYRLRLVPFRAAAPKPVTPHE